MSTSTSTKGAILRTTSTSLESPKSMFTSTLRTLQGSVTCVAIIFPSPVGCS